MLRLRGSNLSSHDVAKAVRQGWTITLDTAQLDRVARARELVLRLLEEGVPVYGINTGFGKLADTSISQESVAELPTTSARKTKPAINRWRGIMVIVRAALRWRETRIICTKISYDQRA